MEFTLEEGRNLSADCPSILLPGLSIGNVGQLAVDLLISSTRAKRVGFLDEPSLLPCVGNDAYGPEPEGVLALPLEAYESPPHALTLIQQRSPVIKVYYVSSTNNDGNDSDCERLGFKRLEEYDPTQRRWKYLNELAEGKTDREDEPSFEDELVHDDYYPGLPFAALFSCCKAKGLKVTCLLCYCSEGDNIADSFQLADAACKLLRLTPDKLSGIGNKSRCLFVACTSNL
uniref:Proteasome assembly chaperone 2 n=1 Tax=Musa acuminata TaxID=4641 RepID=Q1EPD9_MUSAC|nr:cell cycle-regulated protein-related [Musa acuminata]